MFTGLVEEIGYVLKKSSTPKGIEWVLSASESFLQDVKIGDSISVSGVCQTVTSLTSNSFSFYSSPITIKKTTLAYYHPQSAVNLEKSLRIGDRLGGHFVYGHVQDTGQVRSILPKGDTTQLTLKISDNLASLLIPEGSIAIDGVSLTVASNTRNHLDIHIIPHTWQTTTLHLLEVGSYVNVEADPLMKMVSHLLQNHTTLKSPSSLEKTLVENDWIL